MPKYHRPPITEAIVDLRFADHISEELVEKARARLADQYPQTEPAHVPEFGMKSPVGPPVMRLLKGYKLSSNDRTDVVVIAQVRMSWSRLAPYHDWSELNERIQRDWAKFKRIAGYHRISRLGVRYMNRLDIPLRGMARVNMQDYVKVYAETPESDVIKGMHGYTMQVTGSLVDNFSLIINTAVVPPALVNHMSVLLDIDIGRDNVPQKDEELFALLNQVRTLKNEVFEASVTDATRELFQ